MCAAIYYTTDGTAPTISSTPYTAAISVTKSEIVAATAVASGYMNSAIAKATYTITEPTAAMPVFSLATGTYSSAQTVTISDSTPGTAIYYTANGTTPTSGSTAYSGPIDVASTETILAIAIATGYQNSAVSQATHTITPTIASGEWTWMAGSDTGTTNYGNFGTMGVAAASNTPGTITGEMTMTDSTGAFWLFGGAFGFDLVFNNLWKFDTTTNEWIWMSGSGENYTASYGTQGVPSPTNLPWGRFNGSGWSDKNGNLWTFGGGTVGPGASNYDLNDLWKFNTATLEWTWISGTSTQDAFLPPSFGTQGVAAASNIPPPLHSTANCTDPQGNLWMFGGNVIGDGVGDYVYNTLWEFNTTTMEWTWVSGSSGIGGNAVYGMQGTPSSSNVPGARSGSSCWIDSTGNLWIFGGAGFDSANAGLDLNDLWKFNPVNSEWTWVSGSNLGRSLGTYGTQGVEAVGNAPPARDGAASWIDQSGNLWLFGGQNILQTIASTGQVTTEGYGSDLWRFNPVTGQWAWINGSNTVNVPPVYGTLGMPSSTVDPGARTTQATWTQANGNLWLFGEEAITITAGTPSVVDVNDIWRYQP